MTALALVSGTLHRAPEFRTAKSGASFAKLSLREQDGTRTRWWSIMCFSETAFAELEGMSSGDAISARGRLEAEIYSPAGGEPRVSLSLIADAVLPLKKRAAKPRAPKASPSATRDTIGRSRQAPAGPDDPSDTIPF